MNIADFFIFMPLSNNQYDIAIIPIERWLKRDISPILKTDDPIVNPSQYTNPLFTTLFEQYIQFDQDNKNIRDQILGVYTRDVPFMILGKQISNIYVKPDIYEQIFLMYTGTVFENNWRQMIYTQLSRARSMHIDTENIGWPKELREFIKNTVKNTSNNSEEKQMIDTAKEENI
jgi:hypothetical protein